MDNTKRILCTTLVLFSLTVAAGSVRLADCAVVWNPDTGLTKRGRACCSAALVDFTNMMAKVTGKVPAVYVEGREPSSLAAAVYLGKTKAAAEAGCLPDGLRRGDWRLKTIPGRAFVYAISGMGLAYAATDFAERYCGYHYLTPDGDDDPFDFNPGLEIPVADVTVKPAIYKADVYTSLGNAWGRWATRRRLAFTDELEGCHRDSYEVRDVRGITHLCHSSFCYLPPEKYFKDHPEYYSMIGGKRQFKPTGQLCMSNREVRRLCLEKLLSFIAEDRRKYPDNYPLVYDFTQQDNMNFLCECPECKKAIARYTRGPMEGHGENYNGGDAGLQLEFINWIADEAAKKYPDVLVRTFAYVSTEHPPKPGTIKPSPNVVIWWCDLYGNSEHLRPITSKPFNYKQSAILKEWLGLARHVQVWDYMLYGGSYCGDFPEFSPDAIKADAKFFADNGLDDMFMESERKGVMPQPFYELNYYLLSRLYTNPDEDVDRLIRTYCRVYGKSADAMFKALQFLRTIESNNPAQTPRQWHQRILPWRTRENWEKFREMVKSAYIAEGPGRARARMARVLSSVSRELVRVYGQIPSATAELEAARSDYLAYGREYAQTATIPEPARKKMLKNIQTEFELFNLRFKDIPADVVGVPDSEIRCADYHRLSGSPNGKKVDDPDSETGRAMVWKLGKPDSEHRGFPVSCGIYDGNTKRSSVFKITSGMAASDEKYHWVRLGEGWVGPEGMFWIPGDWHMSFRFGDWHMLCDGLAVDPNWYDAYLSVKFTGPAYVSGSKSPNGIWIDRLLLRRRPTPGVDLKLSGHIHGCAPFAPPGNAFSAAVFIKPEAPIFREARERLVMNVGNGFYEGFRLCLRPDVKQGTYHPFLEIGIGPRQRAWALDAPPGSVKPGYWHRVAATWNGRVARLYVDGREVASAPYSGNYLHPHDRRVRTGIPGESYGILSMPFLLDRATVWTRGITAAEVAAFAPGDAFEPDTPDFAQLVARIERGDIPPPEMIRRAKAGVHSDFLALTLDKGLCLALLSSKNLPEALRVRDDLLVRLRKSRGGEVAANTFNDRFREQALLNGFAEYVLADLKDEFAALRERNASHLPYVALQLIKTAERAGQKSFADDVRQILLSMDLRVFPHIRRELGQSAEFTAHCEKGASVSRSMPSRRFFVAPGGDDAADGSEARPFRTLTRARDAVRAMRRTGGLPPGGVAVCLRGGRYSVKDTLELTAEDSGEPDRPVVWCAYGEERPVLDGGIVLPEVSATFEPKILSRIPSAAREHVRCFDASAAGDALEPMEQYGYYRDPDHRGLPPAITDLYQDGDLLMPARYPNEGWLRIEALGEGQTSNSCFRAAIGDLSAWAKEPDLAATGFWYNFWADLTTSVTNVDVKAGTLGIRTLVRNPDRMRTIRPRVGQTFFLLNALCALDAPGEWYLDRAAGRLYVWPKGANGVQAQFTLSAFSAPFIRLRDLHDVRIEGLTLEYGRGMGVVMEDCRECVFAGNVVRRFGANGMTASRCRNTTISDNVFRVFGHGALDVSGGERKTLEHSGNLVANNSFATVERRRRTYAPHLHLIGVGTEVSHNYFTDSPSSAMRLEGNDFFIVSNLVEDVLLESDDQGGVDIYYNASYFGNRYCWNTWRNIGRVSDKIPCGQAAVRFDGNISGQTVYGNRFENCGTGHFGAIQSCGGRLHVIDNNLFVDCNKGMSINIYPTNYWFTTIRSSLIEPCLKDVCITNAPFSTRYPGIADLLYTNQVSHIVRNITVGATPLLVNPPADTVAYGNFHFAEMPDLARLARETSWQPIPDAKDTGPRPTPFFLRARRNDR